MEEISKEHLSLAGEYAVASELCKRGIYAQLTLGTRKKTDLLVDTGTAMLRIQVKSKQNWRWPLVKGVFGENSALVFVDYENRALDQRPDFYVLTSRDWESFVNSGWVAEEVAAGGIRLDDDNCPTWIKWKRPIVGIDVAPDDVSEHKEQWDKIK